MLAFTLRRLLSAIPTLIAVSLVSFLIIQLPPGDFLTSLAARFAESNDQIDNDTLEALKQRYGLDQPWHVQYWLWISGIVLRGDFGQSFEWNAPVSSLLWDRFGMTMLLSLTTLVVTWALAFPIGIYSAVRRYSWGDYLATLFGFIGLAVPSFLLALVLMYLGSRYLGMNVGGLFSPDYVNAPWSFGRVLDLLGHLWLPVAVLATGGVASLMRVMRANLLDELEKPSVEMARAKGLTERQVLLRYPVRTALNPFVSTVGWVLPNIVSGAVVTAIVLSLPTSGPLLLNALLAQDMYLAGSFVLILSVLTIVGSLVSDLLLAWLDPRIRMG
jgi:peptide/nickel transport system permease protein